MGSEQAAAVESAAGKAIRDKVKEDGGPIPKGVAYRLFPSEPRR